MDSPSTKSNRRIRPALILLVERLVLVPVLQDSSLLRPAVCYCRSVVIRPSGAARFWRSGETPAACRYRRWVPWEEMRWIGPQRSSPNHPASARGSRCEPQSRPAGCAPRQLPGSNPPQRAPQTTTCARRTWPLMLSASPRASVHSDATDSRGSQRIVHARWCGNERAEHSIGLAHS